MSTTTSSETAATTPISSSIDAFTDSFDWSRSYTTSSANEPVSDGSTTSRYIGASHLGSTTAADGKAAGVDITTVQGTAENTPTTYTQTTVKSATEVETTSNIQPSKTEDATKSDVLSSTVGTTLKSIMAYNSAKAKTENVLLETVTIADHLKIADTLFTAVDDEPLTVAEPPIAASKEHVTSTVNESSGAIHDTTAGFDKKSNVVMSKLPNSSNTLKVETDTILVLSLCFVVFCL